MKKKQNKSIKPVSKTKQKHLVQLGLRRKTALLCWTLLILSVTFGVYKNFTAIDKHTIHEHEIIKTKVVDTHAVSTFVSDFAKIYYTWEPNQEVLDNRQKQLGNYMMDSLVTLNADSVRSDIPTKSSMNNVKIWQVKQQKNHNFKVLFGPRIKSVQVK